MNAKSEQRRISNSSLVKEQKRRIESLARDFFVHSSEWFGGFSDMSMGTERFSVNRGLVLEVLSQLFDLQYDLQFYYIENSLFVNDIRVTTGIDSARIDAFISALNERGMGSIYFSQIPSEDELTNFIECLQRVDKKTKNLFTVIQTSLYQKRVFSISITAYEDEQLQVFEPQEHILFAKQSYFNSIFRFHQVMEQTRAGKPIQLKIVKRIVQTFIDILLEKDRPEQAAVLLMMTHIKNWVSYYVNHAINVCILSLQFGIDLGFSKVLLRTIGIAAILHDIGYIMIPRTITERSGTLTSEEWTIIKKHPLLSAAVISNTDELDSEIVKSILAVFYHHKGYQLTGYPKFGPSKHYLLAELIAIVDLYDAIMTSRPFRTVPMSSEDALKEIKLEAGRYLNPLLTEKFIQDIGKYPIGSPVLLSNGEIGMVIRCATVDGVQIPECVIILMSMLGPHKEGDRVELADEKKLTIVRSIDPINTELEENWLSSIMHLDSVSCARTSA